MSSIFAVRRDPRGIMCTIVAKKALKKLSFFNVSSSLDQRKLRKDAAEKVWRENWKKLERKA